MLSVMSNKRLQVKQDVRWGDMKVIIPILAVIVLLCVLESQAGECTRHEEFYFQRLAGETVEESDYYTPSQCFYCLGVPRQKFLRWGVAAEKANLFSMRETPDRDRLIEFAGKFLVDSEAQLAAATVLAYQGIREIDDQDVYSILVKHEAKVRQLWYTLASLQDPRVVSYAERRYLDIRGESEPVDAHMRSRLSNIVDCLFHLDLIESRELLAQLASQESDSELAKYIRSISGV